MRRCVIAFVVLFPAVALAQTAPPSPEPPPLTAPPAEQIPTPDSLSGAMGASWNAAAQQVQGVLSAYAKIYTENQLLKAQNRGLTAKAEALDKYLRDCGDKAGCSQPIPEATPKPQ